MPRQDLVAELFYGGAWQPAPARVASQCAIVRGYRDEGGEVVPCTADLTLDNRTGAYNPRNVASPLFGLVGRNTPIRIGLTLAADTFGRTSSSGWGTATTGQAWTVGGAASTEFTVSSGIARHLQPTKNVIRLTRLADARSNVEQVFDVSIPAVATGASVVVGHIARYQTGTGDRYWLRFEFDVGGAVSAKLSKQIGGVSTDLAVRSGIPGLTYTAGQWWTVRSSVVGRRLSVRAWPTGTPEPDGWTLTVLDSSIAAAGRYGVQSWAVGGNTNTTEIRFDNYRAIDRRYWGEVASWAPERTLDWGAGAGRGDAVTKIQAAGVLRRLQQGADVIVSPLYREILAAGPTAYWPLEDAAGAPSGQSATGTGDMAPFGYSRFTAPGSGGVPVPAAGLPKFGTGGGIPGSKPVVDLSQGGVLVGSVPPGTGAGWRIEWVMACPRDQPASKVALQWTTTGGTWSTWKFQIDPTGIFADFALSPISGSAGSASRTFSVFDGLPHHYAVVSGVLSGAMYAWLYIDGELSVLYTPFVGGAFTGANPGSINSVIVNPLEEVNGTSSMPVLGHVAVWNPAPSTAPASYPAMLGRPGETAGARFLRLCAEVGVVGVVDGDPAVTRPMGAQQVGPLVEQLAECARTDDGLLFEPADFLGLVLRAGRSLQNQTPALTVDWSAGQLASPFSAVIDDQRTRNDVTARSTSTGVTAQAVQTTGRMSVLPPPAGVGRYTTQLDINPADSTDIAHLASWARHKGTVDEPRFARATVNLGGQPGLIAAASAVDVGDLAAVTNLPDDLTPDDALLLVLGYTETIGSHTRTITFTTTPGTPYTVAVAGTSGPRIPARGSTVAAPLTAGATSMQLASTAANGVWTTTPAYFPLDLRVGGERVTVSAITGSTSPQTVTLSARGVNGTARAWPTGTEVDVWQPAIAPL
ncbi:hypothetical protein AB0K20_23340 [Micromonospora matsumotoense]|uniref:hypothetical protein n=1 Tax=Micromonospora matsumotoense TaxID=121616 RepID=UPI0034353344